MPDVFWRACRSRGSLKNESSLGTGGHDASHDGVSCAVKAHFCDRHHITSAFL
jgi:hypothetical protein